MDDFYRYIVSICAHAGPRGTAEGQYQESINTKSMAQLPSRPWFYDKIKVIRYDYLVKRCTRMVSRTARIARLHGMLSGPIDVSIDMHDIPLYAKEMKMTFAVASKKKNGTTFFTRLATICSVVHGERLTLGIVIATREDSMEDIVDKLLKQCNKNRIKIKSATLDRGFFSTRVVSLLKKRSIPFVMPAIKRPSIKAALDRYLEGSIDAVSLISDDRKIFEDVTLVITKRPKKKRLLSAENQKLLNLYNKQTDEYDKNIPFITNMKFPLIREDPEQVAEFYKRRWGIETSYKGYEQMRPWTTSTDLSVRIFLLFFPFVMYNAWIITNYIVEKRYPHPSNNNTDGRPLCPLGLFAIIFCDILNQIALEKERHKGPPPDMIKPPPHTIA